VNPDREVFGPYKAGACYGYRCFVGTSLCGAGAEMTDPRDDADGNDRQSV
jgi:hypothetical protein